MNDILQVFNFEFNINNYLLKFSFLFLYLSLLMALPRSEKVTGWVGRVISKIACKCEWGRATNSDPCWSLSNLYSWKT